MKKDIKMYADMQVDKPYATYKKTILGKIHITVLSPFSGEPEGLILFTDKDNKDTEYIDVWSEKEDRFFRKQNHLHIKVGNIIKTTREEVEEERTIEQFSDEELAELVDSHYATFQKVLREEVNTEAVALRLLSLAKEKDKPKAMIKQRAINGNDSLSAVCLKSYQFSCWNAYINTEPSFYESYAPLISNNQIEQRAAAVALDIAFSIDSLNTSYYNFVDHYHAKSVSPYWARGIKPAFTIKNYVFYRLSTKDQDH